MGARIAIVLQAGIESHEGMARALHSLLYAKELTERGSTVRLVFDGAGTAWLAEWHKGGTPAAQRMSVLFEQLKGLGAAYEVCDFCSGAFGVKDELKGHDEPLVAQYMDHPSLASLVDDGYQVWIL